VDSLRGELLLAGATLFDPNFRRAVVLIGEHNEEGALGVILNRPTPVRVADAVPPLALLVADEEVLFVGGPVQPQSPVVLAEFSRPDVADVLAFGSIGFLTGDVEAEAREEVRRARVYAGYAGWGPGQLEDELEVGGWIREPALPEDVFTARPDVLWSSIMRRKGPEFAMLATMPVDPSTN
jgi:putative transcriptional regulator